MSGRSRCPACGHTITALENIPLFSYISLRGRCRHCGTNIPLRYPLIEVVTAGLFVLAVVLFGVTFEASIYAGFFWVLVVLTFIDIDHKLLPNRIVYPAFVGGWALLGVASLLTGRPSNLFDAAIGAAIFGGFLFLVAFAYPAGMGGGDVKLAFVLGTFLGYAGGWTLALVGMFFSFVLGGLLALLLIVAFGKERGSQIPFGPYLALGTILAIAVGQQALDVYLGTF